MSEDPTIGNRKLNSEFFFLTGLVAGVICYLLAEFLTPRNASTPGDHDVFLANRLGFIYTPVVCLWLGWLQRSWQRALLGLVVGVLFGSAYMWLCSTRNFLAIMVGFPCLLGGGVAAVLGSNRSQWGAEFGVRLGKGLIAGLTLGFVYMIVLNIAGAIVMLGLDQANSFNERYIAMMWRAGPIALGISSAVFFVLMRWAVGLTRVRILVLEEREPINQANG